MLVPKSERPKEGVDPDDLSGIVQITFNGTGVRKSEPCVDILRPFGKVAVKGEKRKVEDKYETITLKAVGKGRRTVSVCSTREDKARRFVYPGRAAVAMVSYPRCPVTLRMASISCGTSMGFTRCSAKPASRLRRLSSFMP